MLKCILTTSTYKMSCEDDVLRVGKKLEKMISSKNVVSAVELEYAVRFWLRYAGSGKMRNYKIGSRLK